MSWHCIAAYERENHQDEAEEAENNAKNANEEGAIDQQPASRERQDVSVIYGDTLSRSHDDTLNISHPIHMAIQY